jgi:hypothetical protein
MSSDAIEGQLSHLEANPIFSPSMPTLYVSFEPISKPILDPDDPSYIMSGTNIRVPKKWGLMVINDQFTRTLWGHYPTPRV